jgi:hypothetical protein
LNAALAYDDAIAAMAHLIAPARDVLYLGRGQTIRWRLKARSSSRKSAISTPKAMPAAR